MVASSSLREGGGARVPALDGLRGIAILGVVLFHTTLVQPGSPVESLLYYSFRSWGWAGVDLFFVLSGFLITGVLLDSLGRPNQLRNFWARRTLRIFPIYYSYLLLFALLAPSAVRERVGGDFLSFWLYLQNFAVVSAGDFVHTHFLDHFWSLAIEEQFYLAWPFVVLACGRRRLIPVCAGLVLASLALRCALIAAGVAPAAIHVLTPARLDGLAVGALLAAAARGPGGLAGWVPAARGVAAASALALAAVTLWQRGLFFYVLPGTQSVGLSLLALLFGSLLVLAVSARRDGPAARLLEGRVLVAFGRYSYAIYIFHEAVRVGVVLTLQRWGIHPYAPDPGLWVQGAVYVGVIVLSLAVAALSWRVLEAPVLRLKRYFRGESQ